MEPGPAWLRIAGALRPVPLGLCHPVFHGPGASGREGPAPRLPVPPSLLASHRGVCPVWSMRRGLRLCTWCTGHGMCGARGVLDTGCVGHAVATQNHAMFVPERCVTSTVMYRGASGSLCVLAFPSPTDGVICDLNSYLQSLASYMACPLRKGFLFKDILAGIQVPFVNPVCCVFCSSLWMAGLEAEVVSGGAGRGADLVGMA